MKSIVLAALALSLGGVPVLAGEEAVRRAEATPTPIEMQPLDLGEFELTLDPSHPIQSCILERYDRVSGSTVLMVNAFLTPSGPFASPPVEVFAVGKFEESKPGECYGVGEVIP